MSNSSSFYNLNPNEVLNCVEEAGYTPTGEFQQLNSYENRVFDIKLEKEEQGGLQRPDRVVAKFYRPTRWSREAIFEEHGFLQELKAEGIAAIAPIFLPNNSTQMSFDGIHMTLFPKFYGRMPQEFLEGELQKVGRTLARIHNIGSQNEFAHRLFMHPEDYGWNNLDTLEPLIDSNVWPRYEKAACELLNYLEDELDTSSFIRIHGDCHKGNLLHNGDEFFFVDFDDCLMGPVAQDFWMLTSDQEELAALLEGYEELRPFPKQQLNLFEPLRGLRILHYAAWIARRWEDPSFPKLFPEYGSYGYWAEEAEALEKIVWSLS